MKELAINIAKRIMTSIDHREKIVAKWRKNDTLKGKQFNPWTTYFYLKEL